MADENLISKLNVALEDLAGKVFGDEGKKFVKKTNDQVNELSGKAVRGFLDFTDNVLTSLKLNESDLVKKSRKGVEDILRQMGLAEEEDEIDF